MSAPPRWLFWHRRDLRLADNRGLVAALAATPAVTGVVLLDPREWQAPDQAPARLWFWRESLVELQERWRQAGSRLLARTAATARAEHLNVEFGHETLDLEFLIVRSTVSRDHVVLRKRNLFTL